MEAMTFTDHLSSYLAQSGYSVRLLAQRSEMPRTTVRNWVQGRVQKPHRWQDVLKVAHGLGLNESDTDNLLRTAGHPTLVELRRELVDEKTAVLLSHWPNPKLIPFQALPDLPHFVGRESVADAICARLLNREQVAFYGLKGMGGIGKTALAVRLAYRLRRHFPDGVLWVRLDTSNSMTHLENIASSLGHDVSKQLDEESRSAAVRSLLANKTVLLILDNGQKSSQVRPLLPPSTGKTAVLLTSRHNLAVMDEMHTVELEPFNAERGESLQLLSRILPTDQYRRWRGELKSIADQLGHLPLAIAIAAGQLMVHPDAQNYLAQLKDKEQRLDALVREDRSVRLSFALSFDALSAQLQEIFIALGAFNGEDFSLEAAAFVLSLDKARADSFLQRLAKRSLVQEGMNGRYALHSLLRQFAADKQRNTIAREKMITYYGDLLHNENLNYALLTTEYSNVLAALTAAKALGLHRPYIQTAARLFSLWRIKGELYFAKEIMEDALEAASSLEEPATQSQLLNHLGTTYWLLGQPAVAKEKQQKALAISQSINDHKTVCATLCNLAVLTQYNEGDLDKARRLLDEAEHHLHQIDHLYLTFRLYDLKASLSYEAGDWDTAVSLYRKALSLKEDSHPLQAERTVATQNLAMILCVKGELSKSETLYKKALAMAKSFGYRQMESSIQTGLAQTLVMQQRFGEAETCLKNALQLARDLNIYDAIIAALMQFGFLEIKQTHWEKAEVYIQEGLVLARQVNYFWLELNGLLQLGEIYRGKEEFEASKGYYLDCLKKAEEAKMHEVIAYACWGLTQLPITPLDEAVQLAQRSLALFQQMGHLEQHEVQAWLEQRGRTVVR